MSTSMLMIGFLVLPPGHGKSFLHKKLPGLLEGDSIVDCRTGLLSSLRDNAKASSSPMSQEWANYDHLWSEMIQAALSPGKYVIMVPSISVGRAAGWIYLGSAALTLEQWKENLQTRKGDPIKYHECYQQIKANGGQIFPSNKALETWVTQVATTWISGTQRRLINSSDIRDIIMHLSTYYSPSLTASDVDFIFQYRWISVYSQGQGMPRIINELQQANAMSPGSRDEWLTQRYPSSRDPLRPSLNQLRQLRYWKIDQPRFDGES